MIYVFLIAQKSTDVLLEQSVIPGLNCHHFTDADQYLTTQVAWWDLGTENQGTGQS